MAPYNLPVQPTPFVGRTRELAEILDLLAKADCRLLSLIGLGGMGKTRLAVEVGSRSLGQTYPEGVYFVGLQTLSSPQFIPSAIAQAIGVQFYPGAEPYQQLVEYLRSKNLLLILDNFEHLLDGAELISDLLTRTGHLKVLTTSREMLNLQEEWLYQVRGMHYPESATSEDIENYSAARLFIQCARRARPDFSPNGDVPTIMRICQLVEGMPLALEITAAWLKRLPIQEILTHLEAGLDILETTARNVPDRHRSIRTVFEHSWSQLSEDECHVFKKLSVFKCGFRREAAEAVANATLGILSTLVDKSLLRVDDSGRYDLHALLRQYAQERLEDSPDEARQVRDSHCSFFLNYTAERARPILMHASRDANLDIKVEFQNILAAWDWMIEHQDYLENYIRDRSDDFELIGAVLRESFQWRCLFPEGRATFAIAVATLRALPPGMPLAVCLAAEGLLIFLGSQQYARAITALEEAIALCVQYGDYMLMADCRLHLSEIMIQQGNYEQARKVGLEALENHRQVGKEWVKTFPLTNLGHIAYLMGDFQEAKRLLEESIACARQYDVPIGDADAQNYLGQVQLALHAYQDAHQTFVENMPSAQGLDYLKGFVLALIGLANAACGLDDFGASRQHYSEALKTAMSSHQVPYILQALSGVAELLAKTGQVNKAMWLLSFVSGHNAATHATKIHAQGLLAEYTRRESPDEARQTDEPDLGSSLEDIVQRLLENDLTEKSVSPEVSLSPTAILSERELEILRLTADGLSNREIAERLFLAVSTVKWHLGEIYSKIHVTSRTQALVRARELNLIA